MVISARLRIGLLSDWKITIRNNYIIGQDGWHPLHPATDKHFHDVVKGSFEYYERGPGYTNMEIFSAVVYNDADKVIHSRKVMMYMDFLGIIGGL